MGPEKKDQEEPIDDGVSIKVFHGLEDKEGRDLAFGDVIPKDYKDKEYLKGVDSFDKLFQNFDNAQKLIGSRPAGIPSADAPVEDWLKFHSQTAPKEAKDYQMPETEFSKANGRDEVFGSTMKELFKKAELSQKQVDILAEGYDAYNGVLTEKGKAANEAREKEFDAKINALYPDNRDGALKIAKDLMSANIPNELKPLLSNLSNDAMLLIAATMNSVHDKYIKDDKIGGGGKGGGTNTAELRAEAMKIMQTKEYKDFRSLGHDEAQTKVQELYSSIAAIEAGKKK